MKTLLKWLSWFSVSLLVLAFTIPKASAQGIAGYWYNAEKDAQVEIYKATDGKYYGKIFWLKNQNDATGKPKTDINNPDAKKKSTPLMGLILLRGFTKDSDTEYSGGTIYDPKSGKKYDCKITVKSANELSIRGYIGFSMLGRTTIWTRSN